MAMSDRCPATTRVTLPRLIEVFGLQCEFTRGHDGDHCATATWSFAQGDVFWPQETMTGEAPSDEAVRIRDAMAEAMAHPGRAVTVRDDGQAG